MKDYDYGHELNRPPNYWKSLKQKYESLRNLLKGKKK